MRANYLLKVRGSLTSWDLVQFYGLVVHRLTIFIMGNTYLSEASHGFLKFQKHFLSYKNVCYTYVHTIPFSAEQTVFRVGQEEGFYRKHRVRLGRSCGRVDLVCSRASRSIRGLLTTCSRRTRVKSLWLTYESKDVWKIPPVADIAGPHRSC